MKILSIPKWSGLEIKCGCDCPGRRVGENSDQATSVMPRLLTWAKRPGHNREEYNLSLGGVETEA